MPGVNYNEQAMQGTGVPNVYNQNSTYYNPREIVRDKLQ